MKRFVALLQAFSVFGSCIDSAEVKDHVIRVCFCEHNVPTMTVFSCNSNKRLLQITLDNMVNVITAHDNLKGATTEPFYTFLKRKLGEIIEETV